MAQKRVSTSRKRPVDEPSVSHEAVIERILERVREKLTRDYDSGPQTIDDIERQAQEIGEDLKRAIEEETIRQQQAGHFGPRVRCACGAWARFKRRRVRCIVTRSGPRRFFRGYYYCSSCHSGFCPLDRTLNLGGQECTRSVRALAARFCSYLPYRLAAGELWAVCGVELSASTLARYVVEIGECLEQEWQSKEQKVWNQKMPTGSHRPRQLHVSMDGVIVFAGGEWREAKLGVVYERGRLGVERARYYGTLATSSRFGRRVRVLAQQGGSDQCAQLGLVADGAAWIWQEAGKYFPLSTQILDYFHASEHLWEAANVRFGEGTEGAKVWMGRVEEALLNNRFADVIAAVEAWALDKKTQIEVRRKLLGYLTTHQRRMRYQSFAAAGWHIGSGVMESGCKCVVKARMGGAGMRWSVRGAEAMLHLCAHWRSFEGGNFRQYVN